MKVANNNRNRYSPYKTGDDINNCFSYTEILQNIRALHGNVENDQKSNILSIVSYDNMKYLLRNIGFKFSNKQYNNAKIKRLNGNITLEKYKRHSPKSRRKLNEEEKRSISECLNYHSRVPSDKDNGVRYLENSKKYIYNKYISDENNRKISYSTFLRYCPKLYKIGRKRTDVCGICELGKNLNKVSVNRLNEEERNEHNRDKDILEKHLKTVENQKYQFNSIKNSLDEETCILVLDFKENFKLSNGGNEISCDYYNKRQVSCLGAALIFKDGEDIKTEYIAYFSDILSHDSLFAGDVLDRFMDELNCRYKYIHIFTDCGPHFRSKEFIYRVKKVSIERNKGVSLNYFAEYHGKSIVDGFFGRLSKLFKRIDYQYSIKDVEEFKEVFEEEAQENNWENVYFRVYQRKSRGKTINKIGLKNIKLYLSYYFLNGMGHYGYITNGDGSYFKLDADDTTGIDERTTKLMPNRTDNLRIKRYFSERIKNVYNHRIT